MFLPPKGMRTVAAPMVESKRSERPLLDATFKSETSASMRSKRLVPCQAGCQVCLGRIWDCLMLRSTVGCEKLRVTRSTITSLRHVMRTRFSDVTSAITVASKVLFLSIAHEFIYVRGSYCYSHALLAFGDSKLGAIEAFIFLCHLIEIDEKTICKLAYSY